MVASTGGTLDRTAAAILAGGVLLLALGTWAYARDAVATPLPQAAVAPPVEPLPASASGGEGWLPMHRQADGAPVGWDPCEPVHYVVSGQAPPALAGLLEAAVGEVGRATGLTFVAEGATDELPTANRRSLQSARYGERWAPVLVAWSDPQVAPLLAGNVLGYASPAPNGGVAPNDDRYVTGEVVLDTPQLAEQATRAAGVARVRATLLHELGHLAGLAHVDDPSQLMYSTSVPTVVALADGDRRGLAVLGARPCAGHF